MPAPVPALAAAGPRSADDAASTTAVIHDACGARPARLSRMPLCRIGLVLHARGREAANLGGIRAQTERPASIVIPAVSLTAFIVEDSPVILENLVSTLQELAEIDVVGTSADESTAVRWLENDPAHGADLIIVDVFLRSGSGLGVLQAASRLGVKGRRVVLTNYATADMRRRCQALGADRVFDKSHELDDLISYCIDLSQPS
ncbi:MAG: response regulator transcription factor [Piscinibacter sp.]|uniref:response regulator transcription factor n=1 Tax=Piscinibacter sp. TaxID=1903157 RepID=UPI003D0B8F2E